MSICVRPQNQRRRSLICAGHAGFTQRMYGVSASRSTFEPQDGHFVGGSMSLAFFGRFSFNSSPDAVAVQANPVGRTRLRYRWTDQNGNLVIDNPAELGTFLRTIGSGSTTIDQDLKRPLGSEASVHFEREIFAFMHDEKFLDPRMFMQRNNNTAPTGANHSFVGLFDAIEQFDELFRSAESIRELASPKATGFATVSIKGPI